MVAGSLTGKEEEQNGNARGTAYAAEEGRRPVLAENAYTVMQRRMVVAASSW